MTHRQLAEYFSARLRWRSEEERRRYIDGLVQTLDARRCNCPRPPSCGEARPAANLIAVGDTRVCPEMVAAVTAYATSHQTLTPPVPASEHGLVVADVPRAT